MDTGLSNSGLSDWSIVRSAFEVSLQHLLFYEMAYMLTS